VQALHIRAVIAKVHGCATTRRNFIRVSQSVSLPIRTLRKRRGTTARKIQKLLKSIHPRDHDDGRRGARDGRTDLLPVFPVVNSHRASKQFILIARAPSSVPARVRVVASSTETRARAREFQITRGRIQIFKPRTSSGVHPPLALRRVGPPIFLRDRERETKKFPQSVPWFGLTFPVVASPGRSPGVGRSPGRH
jgi:hypothetical protein